MKTYDATVKLMMQLLKDRKVCSWSRKSHKKCYEEFRAFLVENHLEYNNDNVNTWLEDIIKPLRTRQEYSVRWRYLEQLSELMITGTIKNDHLLLTKSNYDKLPESLRSEVDFYLSARKTDYSMRSLALSKIYCSQFLLFMYELGIEDVRDLRYCHICRFFESDHHCNLETRFILLSHTRQMLEFCYNQQMCPAGFYMLLKDDMYPYVVLIDEFTLKEQALLRSLSEANPLLPSSKVLKSKNGFIEKYHDNNYAGTIIKTADHVLRALYLFLDINELNYHPRIVDLWLSRIKPMIGVSYHNWRRPLKLFEYFMISREFSYSQKCSYKPERMKNYPETFKNVVHGYLNWLKRSFRSEGTVRTYRYSVWDFCDYMLDQGLFDFSSLSPELLMAYLTQDSHTTTFSGRSSRIMVLRQFIVFIEQCDLIQNKNLHLYLSAGTAPCEKVIEILTDEQVTRLYQYRDNFTSLIGLRNIAMVLVGLRMGFRASDVISLNFSDIDWHEKTVSIIQEKTKVAITMPLPNDVGNALFTYIRHARPESSCNRIFIRHRAPYGPLTAKICNNALYTILPEKKETRTGFHILRRTFATSILRRNAGIERVIDSLGHQDNTTVMQYLSFDDERMTKCPLTLSECGIELLGGEL
ncbi:Site-specific recombinase XerD [Petrocella atlantisensis]|uniref:Site-specific recombinase XerD n=1 Tax=Petrocella atlantisensis TaxID=2173034 RepID=A0A3P7PD50_9FIRM|nr:tyrosine-type recombinase/integrase [Petrocella atlantisensis]VDN47973.1 Site-specific recombinase XerD [Petrocella atlantisensis]